MRVILWKAEKGYENALAPAIASGMAAHGDGLVVKPIADFREPEGDAGMIIGVVKREVLWAYQRAKMPIAYLDKGYFRSRTPWHDLNLPTWWRMCVNDTHPTAYLMKRDRPQDRWLASGKTLRERNENGAEILILGSSAKFHHTHGLPDPTVWACDVVRAIRSSSLRTICYRPKPSWSDAVPLLGATFDHGSKTPIEAALAKAFCSITYGSIAGVDSILAGVPCIVLGNCVAGPVSRFSGFPNDLADPYWAPRADREQWISNLAYCHFTPPEIESGFAWATIKETIPYAV